MKQTTEEVEIEVLYTAGAHTKGAEFDEDSEAFELARDLRGFGTKAFDDFGRDPQHALDTAYDSLFEFTAELGDINELLGSLYDRLQGGRVDEQMGYDGRETRSLDVGDVIVVDGTPYIVERFGFTDLSDEYGVEFGDSDEPEIVTDGGDESGDAARTEVLVNERTGRFHLSAGCAGEYHEVTTLRAADGRPCSNCGAHELWLSTLTDGELALLDGDRVPVKRESVTFDGYDEIDGGYYLLTRHARKCRSAGFVDHADDVFELARKLLDEITYGEKRPDLDRDDYSVTVSGPQVDLLYEAVEYAVEEGAAGVVSPADVRLAQRVYVELGGEVELEPRTIQGGGRVATDGGVGRAD